MNENKRECTLVNDTIRAMLENTRDFMFVKDKNLTYVGASKAFAVDCACKAGIEEILGKTDYEIFEEASFADKYRKDDEELLISGKPKIEYRESYPGKKGETRYCLTTKYLIRDEMGEPAGIFGQCHDITRQVELEELDHEQQKKLTENAGIFQAMQNVYDICMYWNLEEDTYFRVYGNDDDRHLVPDKGNLHQILQAWMLDDMTAENREMCKSFYDLDTLGRRLTENGTLSMEIETIHSGWMRTSLVPSRTNKQGQVTACLWVGESIEREKKKELAYNKALAEATYLAERDALTGLYNRKGFETILSSDKASGSQVGFAIIDIDNFKSINDSYGHDVGDRILVAVAKHLTKVFYQEDIIARIGGDEFAVLFQKCDQSAWNKICMKIHWIHGALVNCIPEISEVSVTLSAGLCFSDTGYDRLMYQIADEGLYETKKMGRAGCTLVDLDHNILAQWQDEALSAAAQNVLAYNNTGICKIEIPNDRTKARRFVCGDSAKAILGMPKSIVPEECYRFWRDRIDPSYTETLSYAERSTINFGQTECTFLWNHPEYGKIYLRCGGFGIKKEDKIVLAGYCHTLKDTNIVEKQDDQELVLQALNDTFIASYYLDLEKQTTTAFKISPAREYMSGTARSIPEVLSEFVMTVVDPRDHEIMQSFLNMNTIQKRFEHNHFLDAEYRSLLLRCWCRARLLKVRHNESGIITHVLLTITALDSGKFKEVYTLDYNRRSLASLFDHLPCGIVMYEWDGHSLELVHVSKYYKEHAGQSFLQIDENDKIRLNFKCIHPEDAAKCLTKVRHALAESHELHFEYRVWNDKRERYIWEKADAVISDQQNGKQMIYALYTDITQQKDQEERGKRIYEERLKSISAITENTLCMSVFNLTKQTYEVVECSESVRPYVNTSLPLKEFLVYASSAIVGEEDRQKFREMFTLENLIKNAAEGVTHLDIEYLLMVNPGHYEWIYSAIDMMQNPVTGEITGAVYSKSRQDEKMNKMLLEKTLEQDYLFVAAIFVDTDEFYLYNYHMSRYSVCMQNYWEVALRDVQGHCAGDVQQELREFFVKEKVLKHLEQHDECSYYYNGMLFGETQRLEIRFSYADEDHTMLMASMRNITDAELLEKYRHESEHDSLTDLYNRKTLFRKCRELLDAYPDEQFVLAHVDIKHFRLYNAFFGEAVGDQLLCDAADQFRWMDADYDHWAYGRIEADVFASFFPYRPEIYKKHLTLMMENLKKYRSDFLIEPALGLYFVTDREMSIEAMFTRATQASKLVQPDSPYATVVFDETMEKTMRDDHEILSEMQSAIDREQFEIYLQPKYSLQTGRPIGAEALVRWAHPGRGLISPGRFIPLFESNGFISVLDRYMWEHTCRLLRKWKDEGRTLLPVSVNVSRISAYSQDTSAFLKKLVEMYDIDPRYLELELTESAYVESPEEIRLRLTELQEYGFKILMDDFGSGYSSLNTLKDLPIDILKLDMKFLSSGEHDRGSKILSSMIKMSKTLDIPVIAEGVENDAQVDFLRSIGCGYVQGYYFARPMPVSEYEAGVLDDNA